MKILKLWYSIITYKLDNEEPKMINSTEQLHQPPATSDHLSQCFVYTNDQSPVYLLYIPYNYQIYQNHGELQTIGISDQYIPLLTENNEYQGS